ncbi:transferase hexapeptide repeat family protein [Martelella sp. AD-3]|uniref:acyltransferase n=1 Tax=Martelella sp. AD-3 TaxID=686597 RepID=UPI000462ECD0|nr:transferase hexapeptide repeat family protein [Martelella sp. AD-3]AMM86142.1 phenylacetic acid degradation protein PaaY [Martelella sp. AD-3]
MAVYAYDDIVPVVDQGAYVHPDAVLIGDVIIGPQCFVGAGAVLRGDFGRIEMHEGSNIQETCVCHSFPDRDVVVERFGHIGHGAVLHGCRVGENAMVGMNAVVMDEAVIGKNAIIGAMALVRQGFVVPEGMLAHGNPARVIRPLTDEEIAWKTGGTDIYRQLAFEAAGRTRPAEPLSQAEPDRRRIKAPRYDPLMIARVGEKKQ